MNETRLLLLRPDLSPLAIEGNIILFECSRSENAVGQFTCALPMRTEYEAIGADYVFVLQRSFDNGVHWLVDGNTAWFARDIVIESSPGGDRISISGHDTVGLLERRIVAWFGVKNTDIEQNYYSIKHGPATDIIRQVVRENFTSAATSAAANAYPASVTAVGAWQRVADWLAVENNDGVGGIVKAEFAWQSVSQAISSIADAAKAEHDQRILYDVRYIAGQTPAFAFLCRLGVLGRDLTRSVLVTETAGNLGAAKMTKSYAKEATWLHVGGKGEADLRTTLAVFERSTLRRTPFYPIETFVDAGDTNDAAIMRQKANVTASKIAPRWTIAGNLIDTPTLRWGRDFGFGDSIMVRHRNQPFPCRIRSYRLRYEAGSTQIDVPLETDAD